MRESTACVHLAGRYHASAAHRSECTNGMVTSCVSPTLASLIRFDTDMRRNLENRTATATVRTQVDKTEPRPAAAVPVAGTRSDGDGSRRNTGRGPRAVDA